MPVVIKAEIYQQSNSDTVGNPCDLELVNLSLPVCSFIKWEMKMASSQSGWDFLDSCTVGLL